MIDINSINNHSIIICPNNIKETLIKEKSTFFVEKDIKFLSKQELITGTYYTYDIDAVYYVSKKYNYNLDLAEEVLNNIFDITPINKKLSELVDIYKDLIDNKLLKLNKYFKYLFENKEVYVYGYDELDVELQRIFEILNVNPLYIDFENKNIYHHSYYLFNSIEEEINFLINEICKLKLNGVSLNNIYIYNYPSEYDLILKKTFYFHDIQFEDNSTIYLYESPIYKRYINLVLDYSLNQAYELLKEEISFDPLDVLNTLITIIVELNELKISKEEKLVLFEYLAKHKKLKNVEYKESIKICNYNKQFNNDNYVFMLGFSLGNYPIIYKDKEFYLDNEKEQLHRNTSKIKNIIEEKKLIDFINSTKNLYISFNKKIGKTVYYPSLLIDKLNIKKEEYKFSNIRYSNSYAEIETAKYIDLNRLYGVKNKWMNSYSEKELGYGIYDNKFKGLTNYYNNEPILLSYSAINEYNKCPFKYYVKRILNASEFTDNFNTLLGSLYHKVLEEAKDKEIDLTEYEKLIDEIFETEKEKFFARKLLPQVIDVIKKNNEFKYNTLHTNEQVEIEINVNIDPLTKLYGRIDKVMLDDIAKSLIVIDFKTGDFKFNKKKVQYGVEMQLPIYAYLLKQQYPDYQNVGMYIQNVCLDKEDLESIDKYSLDGITINDLNRIKTIDTSLGTLYDDNDEPIKNSLYLKHIKLNKDNSLAASKNYLIDIDTFNDLIIDAKDQVFKTIENIRKGNFAISPIIFKGENKTICDYCEFSDICLKTFKDVRYINLAETEDKDEI